MKKKYNCDMQRPGFLRAENFNEVDQKRDSNTSVFL